MAVMRMRKDSDIIADSIKNGAFNLTEESLLKASLKEQALVLEVLLDIRELLSWMALKQGLIVKVES